MTEIPKVQFERRIEFMLVEHACLQEKIRHASTDLYRTETIIPIAIGLTYAWLYGDHTGARPIPHWMWWVPAVIAIFGAVRQGLRYKSLWASHLYVNAIEKEFYDPAPLTDDGRPHGWETHWLKEANRFHKAGPWQFSSHGLMRIVFWSLLIAGTVILAVQESFA